MEKAFWKSKTLWTNVLAVVIGILVALQENLALGVPLTLIGVANIALRVVTTTAIKFK